MYFGELYYRTICPKSQVGNLYYYIILSVIDVKLRIRDLREDNDLSQKEVSKMLMCDQSLYSKYERGEREIPLGLLIILADYYNTSLDYLVFRTDNPNIQ